MRAQLLRIKDLLGSSFWFVPSVMATLAILLALAGVEVDRRVAPDWMPGWLWAYAGSPEGASAVLQTIAGSMITIAGVVFSLTLVALSLASSQFGPRLLRSFMRDSANQLVLGTFISTFLYCVMVLLTIRRVEDSAFVPNVAVTLGVVFALASIGVLIYFIHHVSVSIQADEIVTRAGGELLSCVDRLFPERIGADQPRDDAAAELPPAFEAQARTVRARQDGYLQRVDADALLAAAVRHGAILRVECQPGDYVVAGTALLCAWAPRGAPDALVSAAHAAFVLGIQRSPTQDPGFAVQQLVEVAARALSPGINDPFTAIACIDRLGSGLHRLAQRDTPSAYRRDTDDHLRVIARPRRFDEIADAVFTPLRQFQPSCSAVWLRLLGTIESLAAVTRRPADRAALRRHAAALARGARAALPDEDDRQRIESCYLCTLDALERPVSVT